MGPTFRRQTYQMEYLGTRAKVRIIHDLKEALDFPALAINMTDRLLKWATFTAEESLPRSTIALEL